MASKIYTNPNMAIDTSSDFGPDEIIDMIGKFEQMQSSKSAGKRADAQLAIDQANQLYLEQTRHKTEVASNAMNVWSAHGIDSQMTGSQTPIPSFNQKFDYQGSFDRAWTGYSREMKATNQAPSRTTFEAEFNANYTANLNKIANRFSALRETERIRLGLDGDATLPGGLLDRHMQKSFNADNLFTTYATLHGAGPAETAMGYKPASAPKTWAKTVSNLFTKPSLTDPETGETMGGGLTKLGGAALLATPFGASTYLGVKSWKQFGPAKEKFLKEALDNEAKYKQTYKKDKDGKLIKDKAGKKISTGTAPGSGLSAKEFTEKYNMKKSEAFTKGKPTDKFIKAANRLTREGTTAGKALKYGKTYGGMAAGAGIGSQVGESLGGAITGGPVGEMIGSATGGVSGAVAGAKGQRSMMKAFKQISKPETMEKLRWWAKGKGAKGGAKKLMLKALGKLGLSAAGVVIPEPVSSAVGVAGAAWAAHDIYQIAKEFPEIMDLIFTEE
tara:strand:+ start:52 stop:1554 length:1503 start_codon:yes stop_codon:yes gene_type:complete